MSEECRKIDYNSAINYLKNYRQHMDFAERRRAGEPIGSGITEAGCKVIFNQRMKQSGMRWHRATGQHIVDLRTAVRGRLWELIWERVVSGSGDLPSITTGSEKEKKEYAEKQVLLN